MRACIAILTLFVFGLASGQSLSYHSDYEATVFDKEVKDPLQVMLAADPSMTFLKYTELKGEINTWIMNLEELRARSGSDQVFLEKMFERVHKKQLGWYKQYTLLSDVFEKKMYNCVTGTFVYAIILDHLGFSYKILEFDFHTCLIVSVGEEDFLLESTDPLNGFVSDPKEIKERISRCQYSKDVKGSVYRSNSYREVSLLQLSGLHYYNQALNSFNSGDYRLSIETIEKAEAIYPSSRVLQTKKLISTNTY